MKKWTYAAIGGAVIAMTLSVAVIATNSKIVLKTKAGSPEYTLTLNDINSPNVSGQTSVDKDYSEFITLRYEGTNMSTKSGRHIVMGDGGSITTTKQMRKITSVKVTAPVNTSNKLVLFTGYTLEDITAKKYVYPITGTSAVTVPVACNFFKLYSSATYGISEMVITYECPADESSYVAPATNPNHVLLFGGGTLTYDDQGVGTLTKGQTVVADELGSRLNYTLLDYSIDVYYSGTQEDISSYNLGLQLHKHTNSNGSPSQAFQIGPKAWSGEGNIDFKVSGTSRATGTYELSRNTWYTFRVVVTTREGGFLVKFYIDGTEVISSERLDTGYQTKYCGLRQDNTTNLSTKFKNTVITGSN